jgi:thymidine phosphorylase
MVELGAAHGVRASALLTDMATPLGRAIGNAVEVTESVEVLAGGGPPDVAELTIAFGWEMLNLAGLHGPDPAGVLRDGRAMDVWRRMVVAQGGDPDAPLPVAPETEVVRASRSGYVTRLDAYRLGVAAWRLGAGRARKEDPVSAGAGVMILKREGEPVRDGDPVLELRTDEAGRIPAALQALDGAIEVGDAAPRPRPLIIDRVA